MMKVYTLKFSNLLTYYCRQGGGGRLTLLLGSLQSLDWTGGLTFLSLKITYIYILLKQIHLPAQLHDVLQ